MRRQDPSIKSWDQGEAEPVITINVHFLFTQSTCTIFISL